MQPLSGLSQKQWTSPNVQKQSRRGTMLLRFGTADVVEKNEVPSFSPDSAMGKYVFGGQPLKKPAPKTPLQQFTAALALVKQPEKWAVGLSSLVNKAEAQQNERNRFVFMEGLVKTQRHLKRSEFDHALKAFGRAIEADPHRWETYFELGRFCQWIVNAQHDLKKGHNTLDVQLNDYFKSNHSLSPIRWKDHYEELQIVEIPDIEHRLKTSQIPFAQIGVEAFERANQILKQSGRGLPEAHQDHEIAIAQLQGDMEKAITLAEKGVVSDRPYTGQSERRHLLAKLYVQAGKLDEALTVYQSLLKKPGGSQWVKLLCQDLLNVCDEKAKQVNVPGITKWSLAQPYLEDLVKAIQPNPKSSLGVAGEVISPAKYLGMAYEAMGDKGKALYFYRLASKGFEAAQVHYDMDLRNFRPEFLTRMKDYAAGYGIPLFSQKRYDALHADKRFIDNKVDALIDSFQA